MASGSYGGARGGGGRAGRTGLGRLRSATAASTRRITERYTAPSRALRRGSGGATAIPSRWLM